MKVLLFSGARKLFSISGLGRAMLFKKWIVSCYRLGDVILTPTEYSKRLLSGYGLNNPIIPISNGVELAFYINDKKEGDRKEFRDKYGYSEKDKVVMSVGLYFERKGLLDFMELAREMPVATHYQLN